MFSKRHPIRIFLTLLATVLIQLTVANIARATVPIPSGFTLDKSYTGVRVYKKTYSGGAPDYVTIVDLRYATLSSYTGWAYGTPDNGTVERRTIRTHWNNAFAQNTSSRIARVAINGTFFVDKVNGVEVNPTSIACSDVGETRNPFSLGNLIRKHANSH